MSNQSYPHVKALRFSHSTATLEDTCSRRFEFRKMIEFPELEDDENAAGPVGSAIHEGYYGWLRTGDRDMANFELMRHYPFAINSDDNYNRSVYAAHATLEALIDYPGMMEYEIARINVNGEERPAIEVPFVFEIQNFSLSDEENIPVTYVGKIDAVVFNRATQEYAVIDIKTHRTNLNDLAPKYKFDEQVIPYALVIENLLGKSISTVTARYLSCYVDLTNPTVSLYEFLKGPKDIEDWGRTRVVQLQRIKSYFNMGWFPRRPSACLAFNRKCPFLDVCDDRDSRRVRDVLLMGGNLVDSKAEEKQNEYWRDKAWVRIGLDLGF